MTRKILFVGMVNSPHAAKWVRLVADQGWELHFFPVHLMPAHPLMEGVIVHHPWWRIYPRRLLLKALCRLMGGVPERWQPLIQEDSTVIRTVFPLLMVAPFDRLLRRFRSGRLGESDVRASLVTGPHVLARVIRTVKPDLIHTMEFQHAGYLTLRAKEILGGRSFPCWLATNWGSDIFYYRRFADHHRQISRLLGQIDYYSCECERDVTLAREMGMTARVMPVFPNTGGFDIEEISAARSAVSPSQRRLIMVKGYQHFAGRALTALAALEQCAALLDGFQVVMFSVSEHPPLRARIAELQAKGMDITILPYSDYATMLGLFAQARIYLGVSISDAISTSMLEAMAMGAFPIQTDTSCCEEWIEDGVTGFSIPAEDVDAIAARLARALTEDALVDGAAGTNWNVVCERLDRRVLKAKEIAFYDAVFADMREAGRV